jgi:hypothetical protein
LTDNAQVKRMAEMIQQLEDLVAEMTRLRSEIAEELARARSGQTSAETHSYSQKPPGGESESN